MVEASGQSAVATFQGPREEQTGICQRTERIVHRLGGVLPVCRVKLQWEEGPLAGRAWELWPLGLLESC